MEGQALGKVRVDGAAISLHGLGVAVPVTAGVLEVKQLWTSCAQGVSCGNTGTRRTILHGITGCVAPASMTALMGPSGAGKTTLLDSISRRRSQPGSHYEGSILVDGRKARKKILMHETAYIQQNDALMGYFTVQESVLFAAMMKLPDWVGKQERKQKVETVIQQMGLTMARHTRVGNRIMRGISGGEKKRVSIACGLLQNPRAMFLDEPTSGLDSATAQDVMQTLKQEVAGNGCTLVITIHQPSPKVYTLFDSLIILFRGRLAYFGAAGDAPVKCFGEQGFPYETGFSTCEYLLDCLNQEARGETDHSFTQAYHESPQCKFNVDEARKALEAGPRKPEKQEPKKRPGRGEEPVRYPFEDTISVSCFPKPKKRGPRGQSEGARRPEPPRVVKHGFQNGVVAEFYYLVAYRCRARWLSWYYFFTRILFFGFYAGLYGLFFMGQKMSFAGVSNITALLFISIVIAGFNSITQVEDLKGDREVFLRESRDGYYRAGTYALSKLVQEGPGCLAGALIFAALIFYPVGLQGGGMEFFFFALVFYVTNQCAMVIAFTIGAFCPGESLPSVVVPFVSTINSLVAGFLVLKQSMPSFMRWLYYISYYQWSWGALMVNQFKGGTYEEHCKLENSGNAPGVFSMVDELMNIASNGTCIPILGDEILRGFELQERDKWESLLNAFWTYPVFTLLFWLALRRLAKGGS